MKCHIKYCQCSPCKRTRQGCSSRNATELRKATEVGSYWTSLCQAVLLFKAGLLFTQILLVMKVLLLAALASHGKKASYVSLPFVPNNRLLQSRLICHCCTIIHSFYVTETLQQHNCPAAIRPKQGELEVACQQEHVFFTCSSHLSMLHGSLLYVATVSQRFIYPTYHT